METSQPLSSLQSVSHSQKWWLALLIAALPAVAFITMLGRTTVNIPKGDDFYLLLSFMSDWKEAGSPAAHFHLLVSQFSGHRLIFTRCMALLGYLFTGRLNLVFLQVSSWLGWLVLTFGLAAMTPSLRRDPIMALPLTLLLMHPQGLTNFLMAIAMCCMWGTVFSFLALATMFSRRRTIFCLSLVFATTAAASFVNGILAFPVAVLGLVAQRRFARAGIFLALGGLVWALYFTHYSSQLAPLNLAGLAYRAVIMAGGMFVVLRLPEWTAVMGGVAIFLPSAWLVSSLWVSRRLPVHLWFAVLLVLTILMAARGRTGWPPYYMLQDRYQLYGLLLLAVCYLAVAEFFLNRRRLVLWFASGLAFVFCFISYADRVAPMLMQRQWCRATAMNWQLGQYFICTVPEGWPATSRWLQHAYDNGVYELPRIFTDVELAAIRAARSTPINATQQLRLEPDGASCGQIGFPDAGPAASPSETPLFAILTVDRRDFVLPVVHQRERFAKIFSQFSLVNPEYGLLLPGAVCFKGRHEVRCFARAPGGAGLKICWSGFFVYP
ncbi:MAG TPA: hypothetical protein VNV14_01285 [Opitutaceae bacterium]|jgi:hypothetical protein|nr:hypothetical protein [Opitutaceae bacterium]